MRQHPSAERLAPPTVTWRRRTFAPAVVSPLLAGWILLATGTAETNGTYTAKTIAATSAGLAVLAAALVLPGFRVPRATAPYLVPWAIGSALGAALAATLVFGRGLFNISTDIDGPILIFTAASMLALSCTLAGHYQWWCWIGVLMLVTAAGVMVIQLIAKPTIDVWHILDTGARSIVERRNMFTECQPGNADPLTHCVYPYLPFTSIVQLPFRTFFGDIRYSYVFAAALSSILVYRLTPRPWAAGVAALMLVRPKALVLIIYAWTEPLLLVGLCLMVLATVERRHTWAIAGFALALACKQHVLLLVPLAAWWPAFGVRRTAISVGSAFAVTLPWILVDPSAFKSDVLDFNLHLAPRLDSLSLYTLAIHADWTPHFAIVGGLTLAVIGLALWVLPRDATGFTLGSTFVLYTFTLLNKQSFFNHYTLVSGLLLLGVAAVVRSSQTDATPAGRHALT